VTSSSANGEPQTFALPSGGTFKGQVTFGHEADFEMGAALICLVDYVQVPCVQRQAGLVTRFTMAPRTEQSFDVSLPRLADGLHDFLVVVFYMPDVHTLDPVFRADTRLMFHFDRSNLLVGQTTQRPQMVNHTFNAPDKLAEGGMNFLALLRPGQDWEKDEPWREAKVTAGQTIPYTIAWNNPDTRSASFVAIALFDYQQVALSDTHPALLAEVGSQQRAEVSGQLLAPATGGEREFLILIIESPFTELRQQMSASQAENVFVYSTDRLLVSVP
jgi:hypothetical protein